MCDVNQLLTFEVPRDDKVIINVVGEDGLDITCMIDTGANVPIWFMGDELLKLHYPSSKPINIMTIINGLGKKPLLNVPVWKIPEFSMNDGNGKKIVFHDLIVPVIDAKKFAVNMLIPLTMLNRTKFSFDYVKSANYGYFTIESEKESFFVRPLYYPDNDKYLNKIQAFVQEGA